MSRTQAKAFYKAFIKGLSKAEQGELFAVAPVVQVWRMGGNNYLFSNLRQAQAFKAMRNYNTMELVAVINSVTKMLVY